MSLKQVKRSYIILEAIAAVLETIGHIIYLTGYTNHHTGLKSHDTVCAHYIATSAMVHNYSVMVLEASVRGTVQLDS